MAKINSKTKKIPQPAFKVGDEVELCVKTLYGEDRGIIVEVDRTFRDVRKIYENNKVLEEYDGLVHEERHIKNCVLPYRFDGVTLEIDYPQADYGTFIQKAFTSVAEFHGYCYVVQSEKMRTSFSQRHLIKI